MSFGVYVIFTMASTSLSSSVGGSARQLAAPRHHPRRHELQQSVELALGGDRAVTGREDSGEQPGDLSADGGRQAGEPGGGAVVGGHPEAQQVCTIRSGATTSPWCARCCRPRAVLAQAAGGRASRMRVPNTTIWGLVSR
jgi:hypothetical protein